MVSKFFLILAVGCVGCAHIDLDETYIKESFISSRWLEFIQDGATTREQVIQALGRPTEVYVNRRIFLFRLLLVEQDFSAHNYKNRMSRMSAGYNFLDPAAVNKRRQHLSLQGSPFLVSGRAGDEKNYWKILGREAEYSLVLVFDENGTLKTHNLVRVMP